MAETKRNTIKIPGIGEYAPRKILWVAALALIAGSLGWLAWRHNSELAAHVSRVTEMLAGLGPLGAAAFVASAAIWIALWLPASLIFLVSGAVWGLVWGLLVALGANFFAGVIAFAIAKTYLSGQSEDQDPRDSKLALVRCAVQKEGSRGAFLLRFSALPVSAISYGLGAAGLPWRHFLPASLAIVPTTWVYVATGHAAGLAAASSTRSPTEWALLGASILGTVVVMVLLGRRAKQLLDDTLEQAHGADSSDELAPDDSTQDSTLERATI